MIGRESVGVRLRITSSTVTAADIEAKLGIKPDESTKIGDKLGVFGAIEKTHSYTLISSAPPSAQLEEHIQFMIRRLAPVAAKIGELAGAATIRFICVVQRKTVPPIGLGRDEVRWLGVMGAQLDVEVTVLADPEREALRAKKLPTT